MKKILTVLMSVFLTTPAFASYHSSTTINNTTINNVSNDDKTASDVYGVKLDAPDLVVVNDNVSVGLEGSKDLHQTNFSEGWEVLGKVTLKYTLFDFRKK